MKLTQLRYFQGICRWGSLSRAARELHISQSVLSGTIKELEEEFGVLLFSRSGRGLVLPPEPEVAVIPVEDLPAARVCLVRKEGRKLSPLRRAVHPHGEGGRRGLGAGSFYPCIVKCAREKIQ